jgi:hypothetical protein
VTVEHRVRRHPWSTHPSKIAKGGAASNLSDSENPWASLRPHLSRNTVSNEKVQHPRFCSQQKSLPCGRLSEEKAGRTVPAFGKTSGSDDNVRATQNAYCAGAAGALEPEASCSRSFFIRLTSTRPPLMRFGFAPASALAASGAGALPMPTT